MTLMVEKVFLNGALKVLTVKEMIEKLKLIILSKVTTNMEKEKHAVGEKICNTCNQ